ncbi:MAG: dienelactone hydrolase family protein [Actinomycetota bacterium]|nr:dienelactone hydrolase family protein [Actinomycetota bacterium]
MASMQIVNGVNMYRADPEGHPRGALIVIHEIWGLVDHIIDIASRYAGEGYIVMAPDLLSDVGVTPEIGLELMAMMNEPDEATRTANQPRLREAFGPARSPEFAATAVAKLKSVVDALEAEPGIEGRIGVLGFCFGGSFSFALAEADPRVKAAVPFYGGAQPGEVASIRCPVLAFYGDQDTALMNVLPALEAAMTDAGVDFTAKVYVDAGHAFFNDTNPRTFDPAAAGDAWGRSLEFLRAKLG